MIYGEAKIAFSTAWNSSKAWDAGRTLLMTLAGDLGGLVLGDLGTTVISDPSFNTASPVVATICGSLVSVATGSSELRSRIPVASSVGPGGNGITVSIGSVEGEEVP